MIWSKLNLVLAETTQSLDDGSQTSPVVKVIVALVPVLIFLGVFMVLLRRLRSHPVYAAQIKAFDRQKEHYEKVEATLERIAQALEKRS